jgi:hypothetical protein
MANPYKNPSPGKSDGPGKVGTFKPSAKGKPYKTTQPSYQKGKGK